MTLSMPTSPGEGPDDFPDEDPSSATSAFLACLVCDPPLYQFYSEGVVLNVTAAIRLHQKQSTTRRFPPANAGGVAQGLASAGCSTTTGAPASRRAFGSGSDDSLCLPARPLTTLNSFVLNAHCRLSPESASRAVCPYSYFVPLRMDRRAAYCNILQSFTKLSRPALDVDSERKASPFPSYALFAWKYVHWESFVKSCPDVYASFPQPNLSDLFSLYDLLPRKVQKGLDALVHLTSSVYHADTQREAATEAFPRSAASTNYRRAFDFLETVQPSSSNELMSAFGREFFSGGEQNSGAAASTVASLYDDLNVLINSLIHQGHRNIALHVVIATHRHRPADRLLGTFQQILSTLPSIKMTTVMLAMNVWHILHSIAPRSLEYSSVASHLVDTLLHYLQHNDVSSRMTALVGLRSILSWKAGTYRTLILHHLEDFLLAIIRILYHSGSRATSARAMAQLAAATLRDLLWLALEDNTRPFVLAIQNVVAHAINSIARVSSSSTPGPATASTSHNMTLSAHFEMMDGEKPLAESAVEMPDFLGSKSLRRNSTAGERSGAGCWVLDSLNGEESDFSQEVVASGVPPTAGDGVIAGALTLSAFLSAWHTSKCHDPSFATSVPLSPPRPPSMCSSPNSSSQTTKRFDGVPLLASHHEVLTAVRACHGTPYAKQSGRPSTAERGALDGDWIPATLEMTHCVLSPVFPLASDKTSSLDDNSRWFGSAPSGAAPPLNGGGSSGLGASPAREGRTVDLSFFIPDEAAAYFFTNSEIDPAARASVEQLLPLIARAFGARLSLECVTAGLVPVVNRMIQAVKAAPLNQLSSAAPSSVLSQSLLSSSLLLCALAPLRPQLFQAVFCRQLAHTLSYALQYGSPCFSRCALPVLGLLAHNCPYEPHGSSCFPILNRLMKTGLAAPFSHVLTTVSESMVSLFPSLAISAEHLMRNRIQAALGNAEEAFTPPALLAAPTTEESDMSDLPSSFLADHRRLRSSASNAGNKASHKMATQKLCFRVLQLLGATWKSISYFLLQHCITYTEHSVVELRLLAVHTCASLLLQDCGDECHSLHLRPNRAVFSINRARWRADPTHGEPRQKSVMRSEMDAMFSATSVTRSVTWDVPGYSSPDTEGMRVPSYAAAWTAMRRGAGTCAHNADQCFRGVFHINTTRALVHRLVSIAVCDPEDYVRLAALKSLRADLIPFIYPHEDAVDSLFVVLHDASVVNRTEALRVLHLLAPRNPSMVYARLRKVFLRKLDHFLLVHFQREEEHRNAKKAAATRRRDPYTGAILANSGEIRAIDEDVALLIEISITFLSSFSLYLPHLLMILRYVFQQSSTYSKSAVVNALRLFTQLHDGSSPSDALLFKPFLVSITQQLLRRDGDTERLLATVEALQSLHQSKALIWSNSELLPTIRLLHSLNYQKPSIEPGLSMAIIKLLGMISSRQMLVASELYHPLPLLLQKPRDLYEVPPLSIMYGLRMMTNNKTPSSSVLRFSTHVWPDMTLQVLLHSLMDHISYTSPLPADSIRMCLRTILEIISSTEASHNVVVHLPTFISVFLHLANTIAVTHQRLSALDTSSLLYRLSGVIRTCRERMVTLMPLLRSFLLLEWDTGSAVIQLSCCCVVEALAMCVPGLMRRDSELWVQKIISSLLLVKMEEKDAKDIIQLMQSSEVELDSEFQECWRLCDPQYCGESLFTIFALRALQALQPLAQQTCIKVSLNRLSKLLQPSGVLSAAKEAETLQGSGSWMATDQWGSLTRVEVTPTADVEDNEAIGGSFQRPRQERYDYLDLLQIPRERLTAQVNRQVSWTIIQYMSGAVGTESCASMVVEQCLHCLQSLAECHYYAMQKAQQMTVAINDKGLTDKSDEERLAYLRQKSSWAERRYESQWLQPSPLLNLSYHHPVEGTTSFPVSDIISWETKAEMDMLACMLFCFARAGEGSQLAFKHRITLYLAMRFGPESAIAKYFHGSSSSRVFLSPPISVHHRCRTLSSCSDGGIARAMRSRNGSYSPVEDSAFASGSPPATPFPQNTSEPNRSSYIPITKGGVNSRHSMHDSTGAATPRHSWLSPPSPLVRETLSSPRREWMETLRLSSRTASVSPLLWQFEKSFQISNRNTEDWKAWFQHLCFLLIDLSSDTSVKLCEPLIKTHKVPILYTDIVSIAFLSNLAAFNITELRTFFELFHRFFAVERQIPYSVAVEMLRVAHFLLLFGSSLFLPEMQALVESELTPSFMVMVSRRAMNPSFLMFYLEKLVFTTLQLSRTSVNAFMDGITSCLHYVLAHSYLLQHRVRSSFVNAEFLSGLLNRHLMMPLACNASSSLCASFLLRHIHSITQFIHSVTLLDANTTVLAVLGWGHTAARVHLSPFASFLEQEPAYVAHSGASGFSEFASAVLKSMYSFMWLFGFGAMYRLWVQVRGMLVLDQAKVPQSVHDGDGRAGSVAGAEGDEAVHTFSGNPGVAASHEDMETVLSIMHYAALASTVLSNWDSVLEVAVMTRNVSDVMLAGGTASRSMASSTLSHGHRSSERRESPVPQVLIQSELNHAAALVSTSEVSAAKEVLEHVRDLLQREATYSLFKTDNSVAKVELNCMYQQAADLEEAIQAIELLHRYPDSASTRERVKRRLRSVALRPFAPNFSTLQSTCIVAIRSAILPISWQLQNIFMLCEQLHDDGLPMKSVECLHHFEQLLSREQSEGVISFDEERECWKEMKLERFRLLLKSFWRKEDLTLLHTSILSALRRDLAQKTPFDSQTDYASMTTVAFTVGSSPHISVSELGNPMTPYQANLLLLSLSCSRALNPRESVLEPDAGSPLQASRSKRLTNSSFSPELRSPHSQVLEAALGSLSSLHLPESADSNAQESALLSEYYLLEHAISFAPTPMPAVWMEFGLVLFDVCVAIHAEYKRTGEMETLRNFLEQSRKAIRALQEAAKLWRQEAFEDAPRGIGSFCPVSNPRRRHALNAFPTGHLCAKGLYLAVLCEESSELCEMTLTGSPSDNDASASGSASTGSSEGGLSYLDFSPQMYVLWAGLFPVLIAHAKKFAFLYRRIQEICMDSISFTHQFLPVLISSFEKSSPSPTSATEATGSYKSEMLQKISQKSPSHAKAVYQTIRMCRFAAVDSTSESEIQLSGESRLPLSAWLIGQRTFNLHGGDEEDMGYDRGILCLARRTVQDEVLITMLLADGSELHFHRRGVPREDGDRDLGRSAASFPCRSPLQQYPSSRSLGSHDTERSPDALMEFSITLLISYFPLLHFRTPMVIPVDWSRFITRLPGRVSHTNSWQATLPPSLRTSLFLSDSAYPSSIMHLQSAFDVLQRNRELANSLELCHAASSSSGHQDALPHFDNEGASRRRHTEQVLYSKAITAAFDAGDLDPLLKYLEGAVLEAGKGSDVRVFDSQFERHTHEASLPRSFEHLSQLYSSLLPIIQESQEKGELSEQLLKQVRLMLLRVESPRFTEGLQLGFHVEATCPSQWMDARRDFSREIAEWSALEYFLDINHRCSDVFFIDTVSGHVGVHNLGRCALKANKETLVESSIDFEGTDVLDEETMGKCKQLLPLLSMTSDCSPFRLTKSMERIFWLGTSKGSFLTYLAESLHKIALFRRELVGLAEYGLDLIAVSRNGDEGWGNVSASSAFSGGSLCEDPIVLLLPKDVRPKLRDPPRPCFNSASFRAKLAFSAPLARRGDMEEQMRRDVLSYLEEEGHQRPMRDDAVLPAAATSPDTSFLSPAASSSAIDISMYDWASLLIDIAVDDSSLIGTSTSPHSWSTWAPQW